MNFVDLLNDAQRKRGYTDEQMYNMYFAFVTKIEKAYKAGDWQALETLSGLSISCIPGMVRHCVEWHGAFIVGEISSVDHSFLLASARGARGQVRNIIELVSGIHELRSWAEKYSPIESLYEVGDYIRTHERTRQADLKKLFPEIKPLWLNRLVWCMVALGIIERDKAGSTYKLMLVKNGNNERLGKQFYSKRIEQDG